jgi:threonine dehydratase
MDLSLHLVRHLRPAVERRSRRTPMRRSANPTHLGVERLYFKLECAQVTGSFKVRGPLGLRAVCHDPREWVTASAGNHGLGMAYALHGLGRPPRLFVPRSSPQVKRDAIAALEAAITVVDTESFDAVEAEARRWAASTGALYVSFDDPAIMAGNGGTLGLEILEQLPELASLLVPVGGGGLIAGLGCVIKALRPQVRLVGVQSEATPAMFESRRRGQVLLQHHGPPTLADGLEGGAGAQSFPYVQRWVDDIRLVSEARLAESMGWLWHQEGLRVEGSAAVGVAALLDGLRLPEPVCVVLTGRNVDEDTWKRAVQP